MSLAKSLLLLLLALAPALRAELPPAWVLGAGEDPDFPAAQYLVGYGLSSPGGTEAEQRLQALAMARDALAATIRTRVQSEFTSLVTQQDKRMSHFAQNLVKTKVDLDLEGLDNARTWVDPAKKVTHALAVLDRAKSLQILDGRLRSQAQDCGRHYEDARSRDDLDGLLQARRIREDMEAELVMRAIIAGGPSAPLLCPSRPDIASELRRVCGTLAGLDRFVALAALDLGADLPKGVRVLMDRITFADTPFCGTLSAYLEEELGSRLASLGQVKLLDKDQARGAILDSGAAADLQDVLKAQAAVRGVVFDLGEEVKVTLKAVSAGGEELASTTMALPAAQVRKAGLKLVPDNYAEARKTLAILDARVQSSKLQVKLALDRGQGGIYRKGEKLHLFLKSNMDCFVNIFYRQVDGSQILIFPNKYHPAGGIEKDRLYQVPPDDNSFDLEVQEPFGIEMVKVIASTDPIPLPVESKAAPDANGLVEVKEDLKGLLGRTRGIAMKKAETQYAEATAVVNTMAAAKH